MPHHSTAYKLEAFARLLQIMDELRAECPWDKKQTMQSLRNLTIEETYELADAILDNDLAGVKEEIGDVLLHLVFYAKIADEQGVFDIADAIHAECDKLVARHPHIYGVSEETRRFASVRNEEDVKRNWEQLKLQEKNDKGEQKTVLGGVPKSLPALVKAYRMQEKTAKFGFDWENAAQAWEKVSEEIEELHETVTDQESQTRREEEFGDVLFSFVNYARFIGVDPETALEKANRKFQFRFNYIESHTTKPLSDMTLAEMDALWDEAKTVRKTY